MAKGNAFKYKPSVFQSGKQKMHGLLGLLPSSYASPYQRKEPVLRNQKNNDLMPVFQRGVSRARSPILNCVTVDCTR